MNYTKDFKELARINTGSHFLDSGGAYGRHWEKPAIPDDMPLEYVVDYGEFDGEPWLELRICTAVLLDDHLEIDQQATRHFRLWAALASPKGSWLAVAQEYCERMVETGRWEMDGHFPIGSDNSYNGDSDIDQDFQYTTPGIYTDIALIQMHNGCDVRGGYTAPVVAVGDFEAVLCGMEITFLCRHCGADAYDTYRASEDGWRLTRESPTTANVVCPCGEIAYAVDIR